MFKTLVKNDSSWTRHDQCQTRHPEVAKRSEALEGSAEVVQRVLLGAPDGPSPFETRRCATLLRVTGLT